MDKDCKDKKKILIVHNYYQIPGGEDTVVANEMKLLQNHGHEVVLYTRDNKEINSMGKIAKLGLFFMTIYNPRTARDIKRIIREENIDIVHVHNTLNLVSPAVYYAAISCKIPVVQTIHNYRLICPGALLYRNGSLCEECISSGIGCSLKYKCYRDSLLQTLTCAISLWVHRMGGIYKKINYICLTEFNKDKLLEANKKGKEIFDSNKMFVKPNFMVEQDYKIISASVRKRQILFAGRLDVSKGIDILLSAWTKIEKDIVDIDAENSDKVQLIICGSGPMEDWCKDYINTNNLRNVQFVGRVDHSEIMRYMSESMATILPTRWYEGFPMTIAESLSVGTPVIGPDMGNVGALIVEGVNGYKHSSKDICVDELEANIADAISRCINSENMNIYNTSYEVYKNNYTDKKNYEILVEIYNTVR